MSVKRFFIEAKIQAAMMLDLIEKPYYRRPAIEVLDIALARAMGYQLHGGDDFFPDLRFRLRPGEGAKVRARILVAAASHGCTDATMLPGESIAEWLGRGLRERLTHEKILPLLRTAARMSAVDPKTLEPKAS